MPNPEISETILNAGLKFEQRNLVIREGERFNEMRSYCHPKYERKITLQIPGQSFPLSVEHAEILRDLLTESLKAFGK